MRNLVVAAIAATITLGGLSLLACAPEQPPAVEGVSESVDGVEQNEVSEK